MHKSLALLGLLPLVSARQASDLNITTDEARTHSCDAACESTYTNKTQPLDIAQFRREFDFDFYATAANFSGSKAGDLLKLAPVDPDSLNSKAGTTVYRIQYTSVDFDGSLVPVTGFVALPYARPLGSSSHYSHHVKSAGNETGGGRGGNGTRALFRLAAWAHGTSGIYLGCAPSNGPTLYDPSAWQALVDQGYAVVGTDYAGIGNNYTTHKFLSFNVHAADVYYSTVAARKAFPQTFSKEWFSVGHSQGGGTVWKLAESDYVQGKDSGYVGTVAIAPATYIVDMMLGNWDSYPSPGFAAFLPESVRRVFPSYKGSSILTDLMQSRMALAEKAQMCVGAMLGLSSDLKRHEIVSRERLRRHMPAYLEWQARTAPALGARSSSPILVVQGKNDSTVLASTTSEAVERACKAGSEVHYSVYPGIDHSPIVSASLFEWVRWIDARFDAAQGLTNASSRQHGANMKCSRTVLKPFDLANAKIPAEVM
ncbi:prolyl aminopeptidase (secreted protein) [Purpureocillium lavendulum]|uniref:Prolyl aminopeptidase (Secreted protein) n=1 Tax=Purpureocillium lavendulum TaxID=1247861 RepID=A0AB34FG27_9HYPO|nr:prolyl aminopeptidase (secreted protein) [Purpureocillium lavendulum]